MPKRPCNPACSVFCVPGFHPGTDAVFQFSDDLVGDVGVNIFDACHLNSPLCIRVVPLDNFMIYKDIIRLDRPD